ncbi:MAG: PotD/PotF family extracellular solute-binding protein [Candidatus Heritagella sp.]
MRAARFWGLVLSAGCLMGLCAPSFSAAQISPDPVASTRSDVTINVYNWGEYISNGTEGSMDVNAEFTARTGIQVNYTTYDTNESMYAKLASGGGDYDVIIPSDYMVSRMIQEDMLAELDFANIPNFQYIDEDFKNPDYDPENKYSVPYTWGLVGLFYNTDYVTAEEAQSWSLLWDEKYAGKILMFDNSRDSFGIAMKLLGYSFNTEDEQQWREAADLLVQQAPLVQSYAMDQIFQKMESGEAWIAPYYSGDAAILVEENDNIAFSVPEEGTNYFVDAICIPKTSTHKAEAEAYINFLCDPEISYENCSYIGYSTPETAAKEMMDPEITENEMYYPSEETIANTEVFINLSDTTNQLLDSLWAEVKMGGPGQVGELIAILILFLGLYIGVVVYKRRKRAREQ